MGVNDVERSVQAHDSGLADRYVKVGPVALDDQSGLLMTTPTTTLLLGTDHGPGAGREGAHRSDSIMLVRTDPDRGRISYLSIPRDLRVDVPGHGFAKINAAYQFGGPDLAVRSIRDFTGLRINHVVVVDFQNFERLIDGARTRAGQVLVSPEALERVRATTGISEPVLRNRCNIALQPQASFA